ncbi:aladin [Rhipicephalus microplus]|uniref:aladin n=1 Tax=Rhipicephalus microplus TaxID=6941 RepID=UPI003F6C7EF3
MCSLSSFPRPPPRGLITLFEKDGDLHEGNEREWKELAERFPAYPRVSIVRETTRHPAFAESAAGAFLQQPESIWKQAFVSWQEKGFIGFLEQLSTYNESSIDLSIARFAAKSILFGTRWFYKQGLLFPHLLLSSEDMCKEFSLTLNWARGHVRAFAWHPQCPKFAVASHGDMIRVYAPNMSITPVLKHRSQRNITDMAWKPYSSAVLAVACQEGVLLWQVEPTSLIARPSSAYASLLSREGHNPVSSIAWHPKGTLLASASAADCSLLIWNVAMEECVPLTHISGGGVSLIRWSPDGCRLLAASPQSLFRVWHTNQWQFDKWSTQQGRCRAACWSPDGRWLLCCFSDKPHLYALNFPPPVAASVDEDEGESSTWSPHPDATFGTGLPVADLTEVDLPLHSGTGEGIRVGGLVQNMAWDKHGERLAISFRDHSEYVALFRTKTSPVFQMFPCGFVSGPPGESAQLISFYNGFEGGSLLTVCWSNGLVSHVPLCYCPISPCDSSGTAASLPFTSLRPPHLYST